MNKENFNSFKKQIDNFKSQFPKQQKSTPYVQNLVNPTSSMNQKLLPKLHLMVQESVKQLLDCMLIKMKEMYLVNYKLMFSWMLYI